MGLGFGFAARSRVLAQSAPAAGAQASILAEIKKDWEEQKKTMSTIADAMPEDKFDFKATPAERSYGEQILHIAQVNYFLLKVVGGKATPPAFAPKTLKSKAEIIKALEDSYEYGSTLLGEQTDASMMQTMTGPAFLGPSSRARWAVPNSTAPRMPGSILGMSEPISRWRLTLGTKVFASSAVWGYCR